MNRAGREHLGTGGFGNVYRVRDIKSTTLTLIALKVIPTPTDSDQALALREVGSLKDLAHPNIVRLVHPPFFASIPMKSLCIALECADLGDLNGFIQLTRLGKVGASSQVPNPTESQTRTLTPTRTLRQAITKLSP